MGYCANIYKDPVEAGNYTYNVHRMFEVAFGSGKGLYTIDDEFCRIAILKLDKAIKHMEDNPQKMKELEPANGWGNYEGALEFLRGLRDECNKYKDTDAHVRIE